MKKYKILMALMGLEIGGAETHVVELSKELKKQGYDIIVASNGGVYEKELAEAGIRHYHVPLNQRNVLKMARSYFILKKIIKKEKVDIVHSHARIPSFVCGLLKERMKNSFTFVTSAHWVFYTGMGLKYISNWGQKVIAVSDDIREYLMENYKVRYEDIFVTINGIDTEKFSPETDGAKVRAEFGLQAEEPTLVYVSRMDESRALVARQLIAIAPKLAQAIPGLRMLIVGGGDVFDELLAESKRVNVQIGRECITMTGGRTDINELVAVADVFVGVSRAALEAMAAEKPVIVAGNEGYIGLFGEDKLELAQENNFCCRGCELSNENLLYRDVVHTFNDLTDEQRQKMGAYGREVIFQYYSVTKMAGDCVCAYNAAWKESHEKQYNVVMSGYYGFNNTGDEAIMLSMHKNIQEMVDSGTFREDLLYRLNTIHLEIPPLRERRNDIHLFIDYFMQRYAAKYEKKDISLHEHALEKLCSYHWPGNIRELQHAIEKAIILCEGNVIRPKDIFVKQTWNPQFSTTVPNLEEVERQAIATAIRQNDGNLTATAEQLGISRQTLYNKIKRFKL